MFKYLLPLIFIASACNPKKQNICSNKAITFLYGKNVYDENYKDSIRKLFIDERYIKNITNQEKAILSFISLKASSDCETGIIGSESNLDVNCLITDKFNLGYACGDKNINFLKKWFKNDTNALKDINECNQLYYLRNPKFVFDEINFNISNDTMYLKYKGSAMHISDNPESWDWTENYVFKINKEAVCIISLEKIEGKHEIEKIVFD